MSEPTYRIELTHRPEKDFDFRWIASVYRVADDEYVECAIASTREDAFDKARAWCVAKARKPEPPSTVFLTEDGDIHDPHDQAA